MKCFSACPELPKSFGTKSNCSTNQDGNTACSLSCRPGLIFSIANPPLDGIYVVRVLPTNGTEYHRLVDVSY